MNNLYRIIGLTALLILVSFLWPAWWWILFLPVFFMMATVRNLITAFGNAFVAGSVSWGIVAFIQYLTNSDIIVQRMAKLFALPSGILLLLIVVLLAGILAGIAGMLGASVRSLLVKEQKNYYY